MTPPDAVVPPVAPGAAAGPRRAGRPTYAARRSGWTVDAPVRVVEAEVARAGPPGHPRRGGPGGRAVGPCRLRAARPRRRDGRAPTATTSVARRLRGRRGSGPWSSTPCTTPRWPPPAAAAPCRGRRSTRPVVRQIRRRPDLGHPGHGGPPGLHLCYNDVLEGPRPELEMLLALDEAGFNHLAAPVGRLAPLGARPRHCPGVPARRLLGLRPGHDVGARPVRLRAARPSWPAATSGPRPTGSAP